VPGYLLDTNTVYVWFATDHPLHGNVKTAIARLSDASPLYVSAVTRGEILFGHFWNAANSADVHEKYRKWIDNTFPQPLAVSHHTAVPYGKIRAQLCRQFSPPGGWKKNKKKRAEQLHDPIAARELGIDENDLWLVSQAIERNLVLVTTDKMNPVRKAVAKLPDDSTSTFSSFRTENWCQPVGGAAAQS
jgi:tRNA(fMet)-specific endonuclease VapC